MRQSLPGAHILDEYNLKFVTTLTEERELAKAKERIARARQKSAGATAQFAQGTAQGDKWFGGMTRNP
jgi:hypothetical protein